ncbi:MAG: PulJ/GspJ family protein [Alphaproteobacteria bacterium]
MKQQMTRRGFAAGLSILELMVAMLIMAMVTGVVVTLLQQTRTQASVIDRRMTRMGVIQRSLDMLFEDLADTTYADGDVKMSYALIGWQETSHVSLTVKSGGKVSRVAKKIDWIAASSDEGPALILYRREHTRGQPPEEAKYIPLCDNIHTFKVEMLDRQGEPMEDPNLSASMFEVKAELYRDESCSEDRVLKVMRIFCPKRFE